MKKNHLFETFGVSLEYMIVDRETLTIKPLADELIKEANHDAAVDLRNGLITLGTKHAMHVIRLRSVEPENNSNTLENCFADNAKQINKTLEKWNAMLLPTAANPFLKPETGLKLRSFQTDEISTLYNTIFQCHGHGWHNSQSMKLSLPFTKDEEFGKLHAAIRIIIPIIPALCASSPILEGKATGVVSNRMNYYREKFLPIAAITGNVIPEPIFSRRKYESVIFKKIEEEISQYDKQSLLNPIQLNNRGAVPLFDKNEIEVRVMDMQECPAADLAIQSLIIAVIKSLVREEIVTYDEQIEASTEILTGILNDTIVNGMQTEILASEYLAFFGLEEFTTAGKIWEHIFNRLAHTGTPPVSNWEPELRVLFQQGSLAERILTSLQDDFSEKAIHETYRKLSDCLNQNKLFIL